MKNKFAIISRPDKESAAMEKRIKKDLIEHGYVEYNEKPDTVFVIGGDGTFIYAVHQYITQLNNICFYGIHTGTLGFYTDYKDSEYEEFLKVFFEGKCKEIVYPILTVRAGDGCYHGLNEVRIENARQTQVMEVYVNGQKFEDFRGTGICVCTQLGSTAYNRSLGGAVIQEGLDFMEMTEIAGIHHIKYRSLGASIVMAKDTELSFRSASFAGALLGCDSDVYPLDELDHIDIHISRTYKVRMLRGRDVNYFERLKSLF